MSAGIPQSADRDEQAALWCMAFADNSLSAQDQQVFERWIADADNARAFDEAAVVWRLADQAVESSEALAMRSTALSDFDDRRRPRWSRIALSAAAAVAVVLVGVGWLQSMPAEYDTGVGERRVAMLEDGSRLSLDGDTVVRVKLTKGRRELELVEGRARFNVSKDPLRPFEVRAGNKVVVATGTSFSVEVVGKRVDIVLYEGSVSVLDRRAVEKRDAGSTGGERFDSFPMKAGTQFTTMTDTPTRTVVKPADLAQSAAWENGQLVFDDEPLQLATARMNRYSQRRLRVADARTGRIRLSGVFNDGDIDAFVEAVEALHPVTASPEGETIVLRSKANAVDD